MEDEFVRIFFDRISEIVARIQSHGGTEEEDEVVWKILKSLTPPFKQVAHMIQLLIPCTKDFTKEMLLGRLEVAEEDLRQSGDLTRVETTFCALIVLSNLSRNASTHGDFSSSKKSNKDNKIEEGIAHLVR